MLQGKIRKGPFFQGTIWLNTSVNHLIRGPHHSQKLGGCSPPENPPSSAVPGLQASLSLIDKGILEDPTPSLIKIGEPLPLKNPTDSAGPGLHCQGQLGTIGPSLNDKGILEDPLTDKNWGAMAP